MTRAFRVLLWACAAAALGVVVAAAVTCYNVVPERRPPAIRVED